MFARSHKKFSPVNPHSASAGPSAIPAGYPGHSTQWCKVLPSTIPALRPPPLGRRKIANWIKTARWDWLEPAEPSRARQGRRPRASWQGRATPQSSRGVSYRFNHDNESPLIRKYNTPGRQTWQCAGRGTDRGKVGKASPRLGEFCKPGHVGCMLQVS